jgi:subtilisin
MARQKESKMRLSNLVSERLDTTAAAVVAPGTTGRYLILFKEGAQKAGVQALSKHAGIKVASFAAYEGEGGAAAAAEIKESEGLVFETLGIAVVDTPPDTIQMLGVEAAEENPVLAVELERIVYALGGTVSIGPEIPSVPSVAAALLQPGFNAEYLRGYRDAVNQLINRMLGTGSGIEVFSEQGSVAAMNETEFTWGLQVTKADNSHFTGKGIRVAVLDTGLDLTHPDFVGRSIATNSFVTGEPVQDGHGHGTHCIGTACGPKRPGTLPRYGIASDAEIYAGKVLNNRGSGVDADILGGIEWAIKNKCAVVSMSLGAKVAPGQSYSRVFENAARRALAAGTLIIAAAGNDSHRPAVILPVSHPANCPSIMAIAAVDAQMQIAYFSNGGLNPQGGQIDLAGPGVAVHSSWPRAALYNTISGTSMATPHVAGVAALLAEANPNARGVSLSALLAREARRLNLPSRDVGSGLVQAP